MLQRLFCSIVIFITFLTAAGNRDAKAESCLVTFDDVWTLLGIPALPNYLPAKWSSDSFAYPPDYYPQSCGSLGVMRSSSNYGHYHLGYQRSFTYCLTGDPVVIFGSRIGTTCVPLVPYLEPRVMYLHTPDTIVKIWFSPSRTSIIKNRFILTNYQIAQGPAVVRFHDVYRGWRSWNNVPTGSYYIPQNSSDWAWADEIELTGVTMVPGFDNIRVQN